jgi:hypothetical protein
MKYPEKIWVIYQGEPHFVDYYSTKYNQYLLIKSTNRKNEIVNEDDIEDVYPIEAIPTFNKGQTIITLTGQITQIVRIDKDDKYTSYLDQNYEWFTPFEIQKIDY